MNPKQDLLSLEHVVIDVKVYIFFFFHSHKQGTLLNINGYEITRQIPDKLIHMKSMDMV